MSSIVYIIVAFIIVFVIINKIRSGRIKLLEVRIGSSYGFDQKVEFRKLHPDVKEIEYVRLVLSYVSKMLYIIDDNHKFQITSILNFIKSILQTNMSPEEIKKFIPEKCSFSSGDTSAKTKKIIGVLYFQNVLNRTFASKIPLKYFEDQFVYSTEALIFIVCSKISDSNKLILKSALQKLIEDDSQSMFRSLKGHMELPNIAFNNRTPII